MIPQNTLNKTAGRHQLIFATLLILSTVAHLAASEEEYRQVKFKAFQLRPGNLPNLHFINNNSELSPIEFKKKSRSIELESSVNTEDNLLHFYEANATANTTPVASVWIDPQWQTPLIFFSDHPGEETMTCRTYAIEDSIRYFPFGSARVLNLTGVDVIGAIDGQVIHLPQAKASEHFKLNNGERIEVAIAAQSSARHHLLYKNTLSLNPTARSILILRPPKRSGSVKIQGQLLIEYTPDAKASSKE